MRLLANVVLQPSIIAKVVELKQSMTAYATLLAKSTARSQHAWTKYKKGICNQYASC